MNIREVRINWWDKPWFHFIILLAGIATIISVLWIFFSSFFLKDNGNNTNINNSKNIATANGDGALAIAGNNINFENNVTQIPLRPIKVGIDRLRTTNKEMYNIKYILPLGKEAFTSELKQGEEYILFSANDDFSDVLISEKYKMTEDLQNKVCWVVRFIYDYDKKKYDYGIVGLGPMGLQEQKEGLCYKY